MSSKYEALKNREWSELYREVFADAVLPRTVHCPLNWPSSRRQIMCDCALNAWVMDTPLLNSSQPGYQDAVDGVRWEMLNWFFGEQPGIVDFHLVSQHRKVGGLPVIVSEFGLWWLIYRLEYCVDPAGNLRARLTIVNDGPETKTAHAWLRPADPPQKNRYAEEYHYWPWIWNVTRIHPEDSYAFNVENGELRYEGVPRGRIFSEGFKTEWVEHADFSDIDFNAYKLGCCTPQFFRPEFQLKKAENIIHFNTELAPGESRSLELVYETRSLSQPLIAGSWEHYEEAEAAAIAEWHRILSGRGELHFGEAEIEETVEAITVCNLQLHIDAGDFVWPCQGGSSERHCTWVWEAMCSLRAMLKLGYFKETRQIIDYFFSLQDGGCPPEGEFSSLSGAIGTSGPKWANATGSALILAVDYYECTEDSEFLATYLDSILRAGYWIIGEIRATRRDGYENSGVMPPCVASDGDFGQVIFTDAWSLGGLLRVRNLLKMIGHPAYGEFAEECRRYTADLQRVMDRVTTEDGFINRSYGDDSKVCYGFRFTDTCLDCNLAGFESANGERMKRYLAWLEDNAFDGFFCSVVSYKNYYIGNNEFAVCRMFMEQHQWKKAWLALQVFARFTMTPDLHVTQERYSASDSSFIPWQPNGSQNGRFLELQIDRFFMPAGNEIIVYGAFSPEELKKCPSMCGVHTEYGETCVSIDKDQAVVVQTSRPIGVGTRIVTPWKEFVVEQSTCVLQI